MHVYGNLSGTLTSSGSLSGRLSATQSIDCTLTVPIYVYPAEYTGAVEVTPSSETQVLDTAEYYMKSNITIKPIPNNYGLITWDGSTLTVS